MNSVRVYGLLHEARAALDAAGDHAIAAHIDLGMALLRDRYDAVEPDSESPGLD